MSFLSVPMTSAELADTLPACGRGPQVHLQAPLSAAPLLLARMGPKMNLPRELMNLRQGSVCLMCKHDTQVNEGLQITAEHGHGEHKAGSAGGCEECDQATNSHGVGGAPGPADRTNVKAQNVIG